MDGQASGGYAMSALFVFAYTLLCLAGIVWAGVGLARELRQ